MSALPDLGERGAPRQRHGAQVAALGYLQLLDARSRLGLLVRFLLGLDLRGRVRDRSGTASDDR
jgi:hypothetical protein